LKSLTFKLGSFLHEKISRGNVLLALYIMSTWVGLVYKFFFVSIYGKEELERLKERSSVLSKLGGWFQGPGNPAINQGSNRKVFI
jgi:hypothetical protein